MTCYKYSFLGTETIHFFKYRFMQFYCTTMLFWKYARWILVWQVPLVLMKTCMTFTINVENDADCKRRVLRPAQEFFTYMETSPLPGEGLQNLGLCLALRAFEQDGIFIVPHLQLHGTSVFRSHPKDRPMHLVASYDTRGDVEDLF
jgi:hypothetical protein